MRISAAIALAVFTASIGSAAFSAQDQPRWKTIPSVPTLPKPEESGYAPVNDIRMYYEVWNKNGGDPVLLLHGGIGGNFHWGYQLPALMKTHKVIAAESRGNARTGSSRQPLSYELMASDYAALLDYLKIGKVSVVGWSDGAILGIELAIDHPEHVGKLYAFGANYNASGMKPGYDTDPVFSVVVEQQIAASKKLSTSPEQFDIALKQRLDMWNTQPNIQPGQLNRIKAQTIVADGQYEEVITSEHTRELARLIPGAKLQIIPNVSHMGLWQDPAAFNKAMMEFLDAK